MPDRARITVHPVAPMGGRRVVAHVHGEDSILGTAYGLADVSEFLRRVGVDDPDAVLATQDPLMEWRGGGPEVWTPEPPAVS
ncbi:hypothetical protein ACFXPI_11085 [Streptomyces sp. NPDC059104]|uniref:hypothetical protein n=1 Tax=Streptomyces sp. NPDC059104 TaxID=3346729 RepID=UPI0036863225